MAACSVKWPFKGIPVLDLYPTVQRYFNTTTMRPKKKGEGETLSRDDRQDSVYSMFGGVNDSLEASDITGKEVVELYGKYLETGDSAYMAQIRSHNKDDVRQLEYIHSVMEGFLPKRKYTVDLLKEV
jgi:hypothetical protein